MIIKRRYVRLKKLYMTDPLSKAAILKAYGVAEGEEDKFLQEWRGYTRVTLFNVPFGYWLGIPHASELAETLEELDRTHPYDNGKTVKDIGKIDILGWKGEDTLLLLMSDAKGNAICTVEKKITGDEDVDYTARDVEQNLSLFPD